MRQRREYLRVLDKALPAMESAIDSFNRVRHSYRNEATLMLMVNAWELLAKAVLIKRKHCIIRDDSKVTISAEHAIFKLVNINLLAEEKSQLLQQIISLRNQAVHYALPLVENEIMHHLLFFGCKFFRELLYDEFPKKLKDLEEHYLSLSFSTQTTYADKVQKAVSKIKKDNNSKTLIWLLERGVRFDGTAYINQNEFEQAYRAKKKILPHLGIGAYLKNSDMVRIVPIQAPKNYTADVTLRKGSSSDSSLPVQFKKTNIEQDYPYLTGEIADSLGKKPYVVSQIVKHLNFKGNTKFHQSIRSSKNSEIHRYSESALNAIRDFLNQNPGYKPKRRPSVNTGKP